MALTQGIIRRGRLQCTGITDFESNAFTPEDPVLDTDISFSELTLPTIEWEQLGDPFGHIIPEDILGRLNRMAATCTFPRAYKDLFYPRYVYEYSLLLPTSARLIGDVTSDQVIWTCQLSSLPGLTVAGAGAITTQSVGWNVRAIQFNRQGTETFRVDTTTEPVTVAVRGTSVVDII